MPLLAPYPSAPRMHRSTGKTMLASRRDDRFVERLPMVLMLGADEDTQQFGALSQMHPSSPFPYTSREIASPAKTATAPRPFCRSRLPAMLSH